MKIKIKINTHLITNYMLAHSLNKTAFCKLCGISVGTLNRFLTGSVKSVKFLSTIKLLKLLDVKFNELVGFCLSG
jgi:DNA-binding Xre family transcriptional regulator